VSPRGVKGCNSLCRLLVQADLGEISLILNTLRGPIPTGARSVCISCKRITRLTREERNESGPPQANIFLEFSTLKWRIVLRRRAEATKSNPLT